MRWVRILRHLIRVRHEHDAVFVLNPGTSCLADCCGVLWGKRIGLWYTHKSVRLSCAWLSGLQILFYCV